MKKILVAANVALLFLSSCQKEFNEKRVNDPILETEANGGSYSNSLQGAVMPIVAKKAALESGDKAYFFSGTQYIRVTRGAIGPGTVDPGYPKPISEWHFPLNFGIAGIDAALESGEKTYFFSEDKYIRVTRGTTGPGTVDAGYPKPITEWHFPPGFAAKGVDAAFRSGEKTYYFSGNQYIRVTRGTTGPGTVDPGYPKPISVWNWGKFGEKGIVAALDGGGTKDYFFGWDDDYIRVTRGITGPGAVDPGYPKPVSVWNWPATFSW